MKGSSLQPMALAGTAVLVLQLCSCSGAGPTAAPPSATTLAGQVSVSGKQLMRDGSVWVPHGYYQIAFEVPPGQLDATGEKPFWGVAQNNYTPQEYADIAGSHADSVRMNVAQPGIDPQNPLYSAPFVSKVLGAIHAARAAGLTVIVSIQDEPQTGEQSPVNLPSAATERSLDQLVPSFAKDKGVLFELFNEPGTGPAQVPTSMDWLNWQTAFNHAIAYVRSLGANNVVIADGLAHAERLTGAPALTDPQNAIVYAAHPYAISSDAEETTTFLDQSFGDFAASTDAPVLITEWGQGYTCDQTNPTALLTFLNYINARGIGLEAAAWDWSSDAFGTARYGFPATSAPDGGFTTFYKNGAFQTCGTPDRGIGMTVNAYYINGTVPPSAL